eukprot:m.675289 g.675289  ORF g.675289 m.675289 type:complete len:70 (+) comp58552_c2_seq16:1207-1416(+)
MPSPMEVVLHLLLWLLFTLLFWLFVCLPGCCLFAWFFAQATLHCVPDLTADTCPSMSCSKGSGEALADC